MMNIEISKSYIRYSLNDKDHTASVIKSPKAKGNIFIPQFIMYQKEKYIITSISSYAFDHIKVESISFPEDSEIESFNYNCFYFLSIKKLQIPAKVKYFGKSFMYSIRDLTEIEIFPENKNFIYYQNQFLLGKTNQNVDTFDALIYARNDLEEAIIPPQVQIIKERSFYFHNKLKSLIFPDDSKISKIEYDIIYACSIERLRLSPSIEYIDTGFYISLDKVKSIEISPKNLIFSLFENKCILKKSSKERTVFDQLVYCRRDVKEIVIPSYNY